MKLLYIASIDFYAKPNPSFHLMTTMIHDILEAGIEIKLIGCEEEKVTEHVPIEFIQHPNFSYTLVPTIKVKKAAFVKRYLAGINYSIKAARHIKRFIDDYDVVFVQSSPTVLYTLYYVRKYTKKHKVIYNIQDMFPGSSIASGVMPQKWMQKVFCWLQKKAYKKADVIVAISDDMRLRLVEQGVQEEKIATILNWFDDRTVEETDWKDNRFVKKYNLSPDIFYVQYAGTTGYVFDYKAFIHVADVLKDYQDIRFQIIAQGSQYEKFKEEASSLDNIDFLPLQPQDMVSDVYSACSVCFIPLKKGVIGNSVPSKAGLLMACKRTVINSVDDTSEYYKEFNDNQIGISVSNSDYQKSVEAILKLYNDREQNRLMGLRAYEYGRYKYSRTENMNKYLELFRKLRDGR